MKIAALSAGWYSNYAVDWVHMTCVYLGSYIPPRAAACRLFSLQRTSPMCVPCARPSRTQTQVMHKASSIPISRCILTGITHFPSTRCSQITLNRQQSPERQPSLSTRILQKNSQKCATCASLTTGATSTVRHEKDNQR